MSGKKVCVIGAGISGLSAAYTLCELSKARRVPIELTVIDAMPRPGGAIHTIVEDGCIIDTGPEAFLSRSSAAIDLASKLSLLNRLTPTTPQTIFIARQGELHPLPDGLAMFAPTKALLHSNLISLSGKLRMAMDLLIPKRINHQDESVSSFVLRRFGNEALEKIAQPIVAGFSSAEPNVLSMQATLPKLIALEQEHRSVILGQIKERLKRGKSQPNMFASFDQGLSLLVNSLIRQLPADALRLSSTAQQLRPGFLGYNWGIVLNNEKIIAADAVILAVPAIQSASLLQEADWELSAKLSRIQPAPSILVNRLYWRKDIKHPLNGSGFLVPKIEKRSMTACTFSNVKFPNHAPKDKVLLRAYFGGIANSWLAHLSDGEIEDLVSEELSCYLGTTEEPLKSIITRHAQSIPQYRVGHKQLVNEIEQLLARWRGLSLAGNSYHGAGIPDCITSGQKAANQIFSA